MRRLHCIDAIRGLAALAVVYAHTVDYGLKHNLGPFPAERAALTWLVQYLDFGKIAVTLFFAVSGFVVPFSLLRPGGRPVASFALSRFFRLYPAYWLSMAFGLIVFFAWPGRGIPASLVLVNMTMLQQFVGVENVIPLYWTLQIELVFYGLCVALFAVGRLDDRRGVALSALALTAAAMALAALRARFDWRLPVAMPLSLAVMFWGLCMRYHVLERRPGWGSTLALVTASLVGAIPLVSVLAYGRDMGFNENWARYTITYGLAMLLFYLLVQRWRIEGRAFAYLGSVSYSIYLFGPVVQIVLEHALSGHEAAMPVHAFALATGLGTVAVAAAVFRWIERPAIAVGRQIARREGGRPRAALPAGSEPV